MSPEPSHRSHPSRPRAPWRLVAVLLTLALAVAACGDDTTADDGASSSGPTAGGETPATDTFPVTIEHAFGEAVIPAEPTRVVTWGWASADAAIALGVVPVAIPFQDYGGDDDGVLPWIQGALDAQGAALPIVLPNAEEAPIEAIAAAEPDLILAPYSGLTEAEYDLLAAIAPTVAYPDEAWATPWRDTIEIVGRALGRSEQADALLADIAAEVADAASAHPELAGKTVAAVWDASGTFYVYKPADARVEFLLDLGMESAPSVDVLGTDESTFYFTLSYERLGELTSDILLSFADTTETSQAFLAADHAKLMPQVSAGTVAEVVGPEFIASVSPPTALSLTWGLDEYVEILSAAAKKVDAG
jgi:iron complex transport system substrate-binding protein